jgi:drug/metabolite transporter (DMT)-like permease
MNKTMRPFDWARLLLLGAIWGGSFIFFRILTPVLGVSNTAMNRCLIAGIFLFILLKIRQSQPLWATHSKHYLIVGTLNSTLPFCLFAYASLHIPAAYSAILNATTPIFAMLIATLLHGQALSKRAALGFTVALLGVALVANPWQRAANFTPDAHFLPAIAACLVAAILYAIAGGYIKKHLSDSPAMANTAATQLFAGLCLLPVALTQTPPLAAYTPNIVLAILAISLLCSALAYLVFFRLINDIGPERSMTVTFLLPVFSLLWGFLFLNEAVSWQMMLGSALVLLGTYVGIKK